jgi:hypothetical protein
MKWLQIHRMITSWVNEHNVKNGIFISNLNIICDTFSK